MNANPIRLNQQHLEAIKRLFCSFFSENDHLWIFGSRVDPTKRGGDIDLYIETTEMNTKEAIKKESQFILALEKTLGEQKIDVVLNMKIHQCHLPIYEVAKTTGILLV